MFRSIYIYSSIQQTSLGADVQHHFVHYHRIEFIVVQFNGFNHVHGKCNIVIDLIQAHKETRKNVLDVL